MPARARAPVLLIAALGSRSPSFALRRAVHLGVYFSVSRSLSVSLCLSVSHYLSFSVCKPV